MASVKTAIQTVSEGGVFKVLMMVAVVVVDVGAEAIVAIATTGIRVAYHSKKVYVVT